MKVQVKKFEKGNAAKQKRYREHKGEAYRANNRSRMRQARAKAIPEFVGVDSEGIGQGKNHRAVLIGVGEQQRIAKSLARGLHWQEVFEFLYDCYRQKPNAAYVGFFLGYDFNQWLKSLPRDAAFMLLTEGGKAMRKRKAESTAKFRRQYFPVRCDGWEFDMLGFKRLSLRPWCGCIPGKDECHHEHEPWMHICDVGSFFQTSFLKVIDPRTWQEDPDGPVCTPEEFADVKRGKERRAVARLDAAMQHYNRLENVLLARAMTRMAQGFTKVGIRLAKDEWYGPGATASKWLRNHQITRNKDLPANMPDWFIQACRDSYYGGWFEIFSHGMIFGDSFNYDINNAYPYATSKLPHLCEHCRYARGAGQPNGDGDYVLVRASVYSKGPRIGAVPYRDKQGNILRPYASNGWYWLREIRASERANLVKKVTYHEWVEFQPCDHPSPFTEIHDLYNERLRVGKSSAKGIAIKVTNNSLYGKFAQSVGSAPYNNWFYASFITSHCRAQILDAIASHPGGAESVLMVATDGICFDSPHPSLAVSKNLGEWDYTQYTDLCLFKPGVYWHKSGKENILKVKSRGVPAREFAEQIDVAERLFRRFHDYREAPGSPLPNTVRELMWDLNEMDEPDPLGIIGHIMTELSWPKINVPVKFRMKSCKQALNEHAWNEAGHVQEMMVLVQDSDPHKKRRRPMFNNEKMRIDTWIHDLPIDQLETTPYQDAQIPIPEDYGYAESGEATSGILEIAAVARDKQANYNLPLDLGYDENDYEWTTIWNGGPV